MIIVIQWTFITNLDNRCKAFQRFILRCKFSNFIICMNKFSNFIFVFISLHSFLNIFHIYIEPHNIILFIYFMVNF